MALTAAEEVTLKKVAAKTQLEEDIEAINKVANVARASKQDEIEALEAQRLIDVKAKQDAIKALEK